MRSEAMVNAGLQAASHLTLFGTAHHLQHRNIASLVHGRGMTKGQPTTAAAAEAVMVRTVDDTMPQHPLFSASLSRVSEACPFANREINVQVYGGQVVWLRGPSGAGKTLYVSYPLPLHIYPTSTVLNRPLTLSVYHQGLVSALSPLVSGLHRTAFALHHPCTISRLGGPSP